MKHIFVIIISNIFILDVIPVVGGSLNVFPFKIFNTFFVNVCGQLLSGSHMLPIFTFKLNYSRIKPY